MNKLSLNKLQHWRLSQICIFFHSLRVLLKAHEAGVNLIGEDSFTHMSEPLIALKWRVCRVFNENDPGYLSVLIREEKVSKVRGTEHVGNQLCLFLIYAHHSAACPSATNVTGGKLPISKLCKPTRVYVQLSLVLYRKLASCKGLNYAR